MHVVDFDHHGQTRTQRLCVCILNPVKKKMLALNQIFRLDDEQAWLKLSVNTRKTYHIMSSFF